MDEVAQINDLPASWSIESFTDDCLLFRSCHYSQREKVSKKRRHPSEACFSLRNNEEALSFNWSKYAEANRGFIVLGLRYGVNGEFLHYKDYTFFKLPYIFLKELEGIAKIVHSPDFNGNPSNVGIPNNKSHSLLFYEDDDLQTRMNLTDYCNNNYDDCKCEVEFQIIDSEIENLRERLNDTEYHKLWEFENIQH